MEEVAEKKRAALVIESDSSGEAVMMDEPNLIVKPP
jgi:hypothetical protein